MKQPLRYPWVDFDVDDVLAPAIAVRVDIPETKAEAGAHWHRKRQLVFALGGGVTCRVPSGLWMVPAHCGVWIPGGMEHSNIATANARIFFVYIEPGVADLPDHCCTLSISPLLRELIIGRRVAGFEAFWHRVTEPVPAAHFASRLSGREITGVGRRGKFVVLELDGDEALIVSLRMTGKLLFREQNAPEDTFVRALITFADGTLLRFSDTRKFGRMAIVERADLSENGDRPRVRDRSRAGWRSRCDRACRTCATRSSSLP